MILCLARLPQEVILSVAKRVRNKKRENEKTYNAGGKKKGKVKMIITKDTIIGEILDTDAEAAAPILFEMGMHCLGCPSSRGETVEQACMVHGFDPDEIVSRLNDAIGN